MFHSFTRFLCPFVLTAAHAVSAQTGTVEGRVKNAASGSFLNNVRVVVQGTAAEAATNESGEYRLANVPAGERILVAVFAGMETQSTLVNVAAGGVAAQDFALALAGARTDGAPVELERIMSSNASSRVSR